MVLVTCLGAPGQRGVLPTFPGWISVVHLGSHPHPWANHWEKQCSDWPVWGRGLAPTESFGPGIGKMGFPKMLGRQAQLCSLPWLVHCASLLSPKAVINDGWGQVCGWKLPPCFWHRKPVNTWNSIGWEEAAASRAHRGKTSQGRDWLKAMFTLNDNFLTDDDVFYLLCVVWSQ